MLPLSVPALITGGTQCFARSPGEFGATIIVADNIPGLTQTIPLAIFNSTHSPGGDAGTLTLCQVSIGLSYLVLLFNELLLRNLCRTGC